MQYAHRDAFAFEKWLKSASGGHVPKENIKVLLNDGATLAQFGAALDWLLEICKTDDQAIIYFSGHGDVETRTRFQPGFLLCWDAPPKVYTAGGAYGLFYLQDLISTLSIDRSVRVIVISDACHSGKLAGSNIGGPQATAQSLSQQYANEIKILSCQPDEVSIEGVSWGGGRGVFSYHLVEGLTGLADSNLDRNVSLSELDRYLEKWVIEETQPHRQTPVIVGNRQSIVALVNDSSLVALRKT
ncbi:MAG: caspase family protein [Saprospiraceae bacterium]|nr:caspase family protein [Saprospiraceae bacterium]